MDTALCEAVFGSQVLDGVKSSYSIDNLSLIYLSIGQVSSSAFSNPVDLL